MAQIHRAGLKYIVDLKAGKRYLPSDEHVVKSFDQPLRKIPAIPKRNPNYREGTCDDILKLLDDKNITEDGVFLEGQIIHQYGIDLGKPLTIGGFSKSIRHYEDKVNPSMSYVCKEVKAEKFDRDEIIHMCQLDDVYICKLFGLVRKPDEYHIFMEYCGHNLYKLTKSGLFCNKQTLDIIKQLCMAVEFAHDKKILHLDIKPENICLLFTHKGLQLKLTDWGSSKRLNSSTKVKAMTICYASPEMLYLSISRSLFSNNLDYEMVNKVTQMTQKFCRNYNNIDNISTLSDSFSIGLTIVFVKTKNHLYGKLESTDMYSLCEKFAENPDTAKNLLPVRSDFLSDIVKKLVEGDSHKRCSVKDIQKLINDYQKSKSEVIQDTSHSDTIPIPENHVFNVPNLDLLF